WHVADLIRAASQLGHQAHPVDFRLVAAGVALLGASAWGSRKAWRLLVGRETLFAHQPARLRGVSSVDGTVPRVRPMISPLPKFVQQLRGAVSAYGHGDTDEALLNAFICRGDADALAALVRRHGPMVWGVCRRALAHQDAEDAFQATFLVFVRKAADIADRSA